MIHGKYRKYNDVPYWDWQKLLACFGPEYKSQSHRVCTPGELEALLTNADFINSDQVVFSSL